MRTGIWLAAIVAVLVSALAGGAEAGNRKAYKAVTADAKAYCEEIREAEVYRCSVEKCPCAAGLREVKRFDKLRTRAACVCTPDTGRSGVNKANATDFCVEWNHEKGTETDRCMVVEGTQCPQGTFALRSFDRLRGHGPEQTACHGPPPEEEDEDEEVDQDEDEKAEAEE